MSDATSTPVLVLGLALVAALAVLASHPRVRALEQRLGLSVLSATGLPFLILGAFFALPGIGVLSAGTLSDLRPAFEFGLGWMGFVIGTQLDLRRIERLPETLGSTLAVQSLVPAALTVGLCLPTLLLLGVVPGEGLFRNLLLLAGCAATAAPIAVRALRDETGREAGHLLEEVVVLDAAAALAALGAVSIWLRPDAVATNWTLPPPALLMLMLGLGALLGVLGHLVLRSARDEGEETALLLGTVALSAGLAEYLAFSGPVVCAIAGAVLTNLPMHGRPAFVRILHEIERPLYLVLLVLVGASWRPDAWQAWVLAGAYVVARVAGRWAAALAAVRLDPSLPPPVTLARALLPQGPVAIVVVVSAATLHGASPPPTVRWAIHAVIVGAIATAVIAQLSRPARAPREAA